MDRLRVSGKVDTTEDRDSSDELVAAAGVGGEDKGGGGDKKREEELREEKEKKRMRGKNKSMKRYLRKQRKNVIDPATVRISSSSIRPTLLDI